MWPDLLKGLLGNSIQPMDAGGYAGTPARVNGQLPPMTPNPSIEEMLAIAQRFGRTPDSSDVDQRIAAQQQQDQAFPAPPPKAPADAATVVRPQGGKKKASGQNMLGMLMQHLLAANGGPPLTGDIAKTPEQWQQWYNYYHPKLTPGQPLPQRMR